MRLDKYLSDMNAGSRSEIKKMVRQGRIQINGTAAKSADAKVQPGKDTVILDDQPVPYEEMQYLLLHKPAGCVTAVTDPTEKTVMEYLPQIRRKNLAPVGRLDKDTEGLLLLTNDGSLAHRLLSPKKHVEKTYYAKLQGCPPTSQIQAFAEGIDIGDETPTLPAKLVILSVRNENADPSAVIDKTAENSEVLLTITEGRFHQVKRMFHVCGQEVVYLKRITFGPLTLDEDLPAGRCRPLTEEERNKLLSRT